MKQVIIGGSDNDLHSTNTEYASLIDGSLWDSTELEEGKVVSTDGVIKNLRIKLMGAPGAGKHYDFTLMLNGAPTALTVEVADAATLGNDMVHEIDVTGGDWISLRCDPDNTPTIRIAYWSTVFEGETECESIMLGGGGTGPDPEKTSFHQSFGDSGNWVTLVNESDVHEVIPTSGTIKNLYIKLNKDPGAPPMGYRFTLRKNGISQPLTVTITANASTGNDLVNSFDVVAGDVITIMSEPLNDPSAWFLFAVWGFTFVADVDGESIIIAGTYDDLNTVATEYHPISSWEGTFWNPNENECYLLGQVCTLKKLYIKLNGAPGVGNSYTFTARIAGADSNVVAVVSDTATTGSSGALEDTVALDEYIDLKVVPASNPVIRDALWGIVCYIRVPKEWAETPSETISMSDSRTHIFAAQKQLAETPSLNDTVATAKLVVKILTEATSLSDTHERLLSIKKQLTETPSLSDTHERLLSMRRQFAETTSLVDAYERASTLYRTLTETITPSDALLSGYGTCIILSDAIDVTSHSALDIVLTLPRSGESISLADAMSKTKTSFRIFAETATLVDSAIKGVTRSPFVETLTLAGSIIMGTAKSLLETITLNETGFNVIQDFDATLSELTTSYTALDMISTLSRPGESISLTDSVIKDAATSLAETLTLADSIIKSITKSPFVETITPSDTLLRQSALQRILADSIDITSHTALDMIVTLLKPGEALSLTDNILRQLAAYKSLPETVTLSDTYGRLLSIQRLLTETASLGDVCERFRLVQKILYEKAGLVAPDTSCILRLNFDENRGNVAKDTSGNRNDATIHGSPSWVAGKYGSGLNFDDTQITQYVDVPHTVLDGLSDFTIIFWAYGGGGGEFIISGSDGSNHNHMLMNGPTAAGWHFYVWRRGGGYGTHIYQDLIQTDSLIWANPADPINLAPGGLILCQEQDSLGGTFDPNQAFSGMIDGFCVFTRAITDAEMTTNFEQGETKYLSKGITKSPFVETATLADSIIKSITKLLAETISLGDVCSKIWDGYKALSEVTSLGDSLIRQRSLYRIYNETISLTDAASKMISQMLLEILVVSDVGGNFAENPSLEDPWYLVNYTDENHEINRPDKWTVSYNYANSDKLLALEENSIVRERESAIRLEYLMTGADFTGHLNVNNGINRVDIDENRYLEGGCFQKGIVGPTSYTDQTFLFYDKNGQYLCRRWAYTITGINEDAGDGWRLLSSIWQPSYLDPNLPTDGGHIPYIPKGATTAYFMQYFIYHGGPTERKAIFDKFFIFQWSGMPTDAQRIGRASMIWAVERIWTIFRTYIESLALSDIMTKGAGQRLIESVTLTDAFERVVTLQRTLTETITLIGALLRTKNLYRILADAIDITSHSTLDMIVTLLKPGESISLTDNILKGPERILSEIATLSDSILKGLQRTLTDTMTLSDTATAIKIFVKTLTETLILPDAFLRQLTLYRTLTETTTLSDTFLRPLALYRILSDAFDITSHTTLNIVLTLLKPGESFLLTDTILKQPKKIWLETATLSDNLSRISAFQRILTDITTLSDTATAIKAFVKILMENVTLSDALLRQLLLQRILAETITLNDLSVSIVQHFVAILSEIATLSDYVLKDLGINLTEAATLSDILLRMSAFQRILSDSITTHTTTDIIITLLRPDESLSLIDSILKGSEKFLAEAVSLSDTLIQLINFYRTFAETVTISDAFLRILSLQRIFTETITPSDTLLRTRILYKILSDAIDITSHSALDIILTLPRPGETISLADNILKETQKKLLETIALSDTFFRTLISESLLLTETITLSDAFLRQLTLYRTLTEIFTLSDALLRQLALQRILAETTTLFDSMLKGLQKTLSDAIDVTSHTTLDMVLTLSRPSESISLTDTIIKDISKTPFVETITLADVVIPAVAMVFIETLTLADSIIKDIRKPLMETLTLTDSIIKSVIKPFVETITLSDTFLRPLTLYRILTDSIDITSHTVLDIIITFLRPGESLLLTDVILKEPRKILSETAILSDNLSRILTLQRILTDTITLDDAIATIKAIAKILTETLTLSDALLRILTLQRTLTEATSLSDALLRQLSLYKILPETIALSDDIIATLAEAFIKILTETMALSDSILRQLTAYRGLTEIATLSDTHERLFSIRRQLIETISLGDTYARLINWYRENLETIKLIPPLLMGGAFEGGEDLLLYDESKSWGTYDISEVANPGRTNYVLRQRTGEYEMYGNILQPNTDYVMSCWVGYTADWDGGSQIFHTRYWDGASNPTTGGNGTLIKTEIVDGIAWEYRYLSFKTNADTNGYLSWYLGYSAGGSTGWRYLTNVKIEEGLTYPSIDYFSKMWSIYRTLAETAMLSDSALKEPQKTILETVATSDTLIRQLDLYRMLTETAILSDTLKIPYDIYKILTETIILDDTLLRILTLQKTLMENIVTSDTWTRQLVLYRALTETSTLSDTLIRLINFYRAITEATTMSDVLLRQLTLQRILTEIAPLSDSILKGSQIILMETSTLSDFIDRVINKMLVETAAMSDALIIGRNVIFRTFTETILLWDIIHGVGKNIVATGELSLMTKKMVLNALGKTHELSPLMKEAIMDVLKKNYELMVYR